MANNRSDRREEAGEPSVGSAFFRLMVPALYGALLLFGIFSSPDFPPAVLVGALGVYTVYLLWRVFAIFSEQARREGQSVPVASAVELGLLAVFALGTAFQLIPEAAPAWLIAHAAVFVLLSSVARWPEILLLSLCAVAVGKMSPGVLGENWLPASAGLLVVSLCGTIPVAIQKARLGQLKKRYERMKLDTERRGDAPSEGDEPLYRLEASVQAAVAEIREAMDAHSCLLALKTPQGSLYLKHIVGEVGDVAYEARVKLKGSLFHWVLSNKKETVLPLVSDPRKMLGYYDSAVNVKSFAAVPLIIGGRVEGIVAVDSLKEGWFPPEKMPVLRLAGRQISSMMDHCREMEQASLQIKDLRVFREYSKLLAASPLPRDLPLLTLNVVRERLAPDFAALVFVADKSEMEIAAVSGKEEEELKGKTFDSSESLSEWVVGSNKYLLCTRKEDLPGKPLFSKTIATKGYETLLVYPIASRGSAIGVLVAGWEEPNAMEQSALDFCGILTRQLALALVHARDAERLRRALAVDETTGLLSHSGFVSLLEHEARRTRRYGRGLSILIYDVDQFAKLAESYGQEALRVLLSGLGKLVSNDLRDGEIAAYLGGGRFGMLIPEVEGEEAVKMADRLCRIIAATSLPWNDMQLRVTVSMGICCWRGDEDNAQKMAGRAETALYEAKRSGGNRVILKSRD
jgi:diguanylate cyclase (GGDEF)-like protein